MVEIKRHKIIAITLFSLFVLSFWTTKSYAQSRNQAASSEDVAIGFYKTGGVVPNFDRWIRKREPYINTPQAMRDKLYASEMDRLQLAYHNFNPEKDDLLVRTSSLLKIAETEDFEGNKTYSLNAEFKLVPDALYFPYDFIDERIALMPYGLEEIMKSEITAQQYEFIKKNAKKFTQLTTIIRMKPFEADFSKPYKIDGIGQWVFKTKIASIEYWNSGDNLVWEYTAPWYTSPHIIDIQNLYKDRPKDSNFRKGSVKPTYNKFN